MFYYSSDGNIFHSKIKALEYKQQSKQEIFYYYFDHVYSKLDWKTEPLESLDFYYKAQAERLREKYDYLILCYSGGYDSTNILETFHFNNIKLDKIITVGAFSQDSFSGVDENHNGELYKNVFPYIEELGLTSITEKFDYTDMFADPLANLSIMKYGSNWVDQIGCWFSPHHWFWRDLEKFVIPKNIGSKKVGIIFGRDKPYLTGNKFYFVDNPLTDYGNIVNTPNCDRVNFYWDPEYTIILVKQLHILKRVQSLGLQTGYNRFTSSPTIGGIEINQLIYNLKKPLVFKSPKSPTTIVSLRDNYLKNKMSSEIYDYFTLGIKNIDKRVGIKNVVPINTKQYEIYI